MKQKTSKIIIPSTGVAVNKKRYTEGSPLIRLTGDEFCTVSESALYNINDLNSDNGGGVLTNAGTVVFALDTDLGETVGTYNGSSQYLHRATEAQFEVGTGSFTSSIQFKTTDTGSIQTMFMYGDEAGTGINWMCGINASDKLFTKIDDNTTSLTITESIAGRWSDGKWHTAVMLWNPAEGSFLFCDGQLVASQTTSLPSNTLTNAGEEFYIGVDWSTSALDHFTGQLANFHLIKSADYNALAVLNQGTREAVCVDANTVGFGLYTETSSRLNNLFENGSGASNGDYITTVIDVEEGLYEIQRLYFKQSTIGIVEMLIDDVLVHSVDEYNSSTIFNNLSTVKDIALSGGKHILKLKTNGTSGSDYRIKFNFINIIKRDGHENGGTHKFLLLGDEINERSNNADFLPFVSSTKYYNNTFTTGLSSASSDGMYIEGSLFLKGGVWRISYHYWISSNSPFIDFDIGNVEILDLLDQYNGGVVNNNVVEYTVRLPQGKSLFKVAVNGKNGSSGNYQGNFNAIRGERIAD